MRHRRWLASVLATFALALGLAGCQLGQPPKATSTPVALPTPTIADALVATPTALATVQFQAATNATGVSGGDSLGDPKALELGNTGYDVQRYRLRLRLDPAAESLDASAQIAAKSTLEGLNRLSLDFAGYDVGQVLANGQPASFQRQDAKLWVDLPAPLAAGQPFTLTVDYRGRPNTLTSRFVPFIGLGLHVNSATGRAFALGEPDGARAWFPANDHPLDKALFEIEIEVPNPLVGVANGQLIRQEQGGDFTRYVYRSDDPMATYLAMVAVADYVVAQDTAPNGIPLRYYLLPETSSQARSVFEATGDAMAFLEGLFGRYPFDSYGQAVVDVGGLSLETQTMTLFGQGFLRGDPGEATRVLVHEMAHQWVGDSVSPASWAATWLNEGFATYASMLWQARDQPDLAFAGLDRYEKVMASSSSTVLDDPSPDELFGGDVYYKGAWVLHMLRRQIGDEAFFATLRRYVAEYAGGNVTTDSFQHVAEEVTGQNLDAFFTQWVRRPGIPKLDVRWTSTSDASGDSRVQVRICQRQPGNDPFHLPLDITLAGSGQQAAESVEIDQFSEDATFDLPFAPASLEADPSNNLLAQVTMSQTDSLGPCPAR